MSHPTALVVIDVQESFRHRPYWSTQSPQAIDRYFGCQNALIQGAQRSGLPIVRVMHVEGPDHADNPFSLASGHVRPLQELAPFDAALTVSKRRHSALVGTELLPWLRRMGIARLILHGRFANVCGVDAALARYGCGPS